MGKTLYIEPFYGASGDMLLAAFLDAGMPPDALLHPLRRLLPAGSAVRPKGVVRSSLRATALEISLPASRRRRGLRDVYSLLDRARLDDGVTDGAKRVFSRLASVESRIHGIDEESVHFHEIGAIDSIFDIAGFFVALSYFGITSVMNASIPFGRGVIESEHGIMPSPAFATLELLKGMPVYGIALDGENITPTAAAILAEKSSYSLFPSIVPEAVGYGAGKKDFAPLPNMVRITVGDVPSPVSSESIGVVEFAVDDMQPELLGGLIDRVMQAGAVDCFFTPAYMKKNRPATLVTILVHTERRAAVMNVVFQETTTIGVRFRMEERVVLPRETAVVHTRLGNVRVKTSVFGGGRLSKPEFDDIRDIAERTGMPLRHIYEIVLADIGGKKDS